MIVAPMLQAPILHTSAIDRLPFDEAEIEGSISARWRRVVAHFAERIAVTTLDGDHYTYAELDQASNGLAHRLLDAFGAENFPVVLLLDHSYPLLAHMIGTIKAGKAYNVLDPTQSTAQLQLLYAATAAPLIVTDREHQPLAEALVNATNSESTTPPEIWDIEGIAPTHLGCPTVPIPADTMAGVVFTSGTIKQPKGVARSHRRILHRAWFAGTMIESFGPGDTMSGIRQCGLGGGSDDVFNTFLHGATYCLYNLQRDGLQALSGWLQREPISYFHPPIVLFRQWLETLAPGDFFPHLRYVLPSGRKTRADLEAFWPHVADDCVVLTSYASTEAGVISQEVLTRSTPLAEGVLHVGRSLPGKTVTIVKDNGELAAAGEVGEIVVRSRYMSTGYWRQPELTAKHFIPADDGSGETIFHTGDYGVLRSDGYLELVGRQDSQVKLRGYRVVLDEVEDALRTLPSVQEAAVTADEERGLLFAYVVADAEPPPTLSRLRTALAQKIPFYALPNHIIFLPRFPLLASGKVNRRALPAPDINRSGLTNPYVPPRTEVETQLAAIWEDLFTIHPIGVADNFFDLGGHSILTMRLLHAVEQKFQQPVVLRDFIVNPTIGHLAALLSPEAAPQLPTGEEYAAPSTLLDNAELRVIYDALDNKAEIDRLRAPWRIPPPLPRPLQHLLRLPQPVAMPLFYQLLQQPWVQQRYLAQRTTRVQKFLAGVEDSPAQKAQVARALFFGALIHFGVRRTIFPRLKATNQIPITGLDALTAARNRQQGVILLVSHNYQAPYFRTFRLTQGWIGNMAPLTSNRQFDKVRAENILYARQLELARQTLQRGQAIYIAPDVYQGHGTSISVPFHGRMHPFRTSFADLALLTNAQIFFVASDLQAYDRFNFQLVGPYDMGTVAMSYTARVQHLMDQYVAHLRQQWARNPWALPWWLMSEHLAYPPLEKPAA